MLQSTDRILTTHVGSLPRNETLADLLIRQEAGEAIDSAVLRSKPVSISAMTASSLGSRSKLTYHAAYRASVENRSGHNRVIRFNFQVICGRSRRDFRIPLA